MAHVRFAHDQPLSPATPPNVRSDPHGHHSGVYSPQRALGPAKFKANPPFTNNPFANLVLRSSDGYDFEIRTTFLTVISPIFKTMSAEAQPKQFATTDGKPIVPISEDSETLDTILRYCYPGPNPPFHGLKHAIAVLEAGRKYEIAFIKDEVSSYLTSVAASRAPMELYLAACKYGLEAVARAAAKESLRCSVAEMESYLAAVINELPSCGQGLRKFRNACHKELSALLTPSAWLDPQDTHYTGGPGTPPWVRYEIPVCTHQPPCFDRYRPAGPDPPPTHNPFCPQTEVVFSRTQGFPLQQPHAKGEPPTAAMVRTWWHTYLGDLRAGYDKIAGEGVKKEVWQFAVERAHMAAGKCAVCESMVPVEFREFEARLRRKVEGTIDMVSDLTESR